MKKKMEKRTKNRGSDKLLKHNKNGTGTEKEQDDEVTNEINEEKEKSTTQN